jgi:glycosyltransferase involved in cell wall biosynthesis
MSATVIIPAHNESAVIGRNLSILLDGLPESVAVIVVCNGCTDETATVARSIDHRITVIEIAEASKTAALNEGDKQAGVGPRIYLDADVSLAGSDVAVLLSSLASDEVHAVEPHVAFDVENSRYPVRAFYAVWLALHGSRPGDVGGGVMALSTRGRSRFGEFPDVVSDDGYVRAHFGDAEIARADVTSYVTAPRKLGDLIRIKARSRYGNRELRRRFPGLWAGKREGGESLGRKAVSLPPQVWPHVPVYVSIQVAARVLTVRMERSTTVVWERDEGSRSTES